MSEVQTSKLAGIQFARAIAALSICYFHSWNVLKAFPADTAHPIPLLRDFGWIGVDFFFVISGFVICYAVSKNNFSPVDFLIRRAFRLYPLWIVLSFAYLALSLVALGLPERSSPAFFWYSLTLLPTDGFPFYDLGWSLQHEMAFYLLAALITPFLGLRGVAALLLGLVILNQVIELPWFLRQYANYYPNFLAGMAAFALHQKFMRLGSLLPILAGVALLYAFTTVWGGRPLFPLALFCVVVGFANLRMMPGSLFERFATSLGDASYSIYLLHPLVFGVVYWKLSEPLPPLWAQEPMRIGSIVAVCFLALISWQMIEKPMVRLGSQLARAASERVGKTKASPSV